MKRNYSVFVSFLLLLAAACTKEQITSSDNIQTLTDEQETGQGEIGQPERTRKVSLDFTLGEDIVDEESGKASISDAGAFTWSTGDEIAVSGYNVSTGEYTMFKFTCREGGSKQATFEAEIPDGYLTYGYAVFPYDAGHSYDGTDLTVNFPSEIAYNSPTPMMLAQVNAHGTDDFQHLGSLVKVIYNYSPRGTDNLVVSSDGIAGTYRVNLSDKTLSAVSTTHTATYRFSAISGIETKEVYVMLPPGTRTLGVSLKKGDTVWDESTKTGKSHIYRRGYLSRVPAITLPKFSEVYLLGNGFACGWNRDQEDFKMNKAGRIYSWTGLMQKGQDFRFTINNDAWWPSLIPSDGSTVEDGTSAGLTLGGSDSSTQFSVSKDGEYTITIDATDMDNLTYSIALNAEIPTPQYIFGDATQKGWDVTADSDYQLTADRNAGFLHYCWTGDLRAGSFKFFTEAGSWGKIWNRGGTSGTDWFNLAWRETAPAGDEDLNFSVENTGNFTVTCDMADKKLIVKANDVSTMYLVGWAVDADGTYKDNEWTTTDFPLTETAAGSGIYTNTSPYTLKQDWFRFSLEPGKAGGWYRNPDIEWGTLFSIYDMNDNEYMFYNVTTGSYTITVNTNTMKVTMTLNE